MSIIIPFLYILVIACEISFFFNKPIGSTISISFIVSTLLVYIGGLVGDIRIGLIIGFISIIAFFVVICRELISQHKFGKKSNKLIVFKQNVCQVSVITFCILYVLIVLISYNRQFSFVDEYYHWGISAREQFRLHKLYCVNESLLFYHKDYPPFLQCLESLWCMLSLEFKESTCYIALLTFDFSFFVNALNGIKKNKTSIIKVMFFIIITILSGLIIVSSFKDVVYSPGLFNSVYADWPLALVFGYSMYLIITKEQTINNTVDLTLCLIALSLIKQAGLLVSILLAIIYLVKLLINKKDTKLCFLLVLPIIFYIAWVMYSNSFAVASQFSFSITSIKNIIATILYKSYSNQQLEVISNYTWSINNTYLIKGFLKFNYWHSIILISILMFFVLYLYRKSYKKSITYTLLYIICSYVYKTIMLIMYLFIFDISEGIAVSCFERYMSIMIFAGYCCTIMIFLDYINQSKQYYLSCLCIILMILFNNVNAYKLLIPSNNTYTINDLILDYHEKYKGKILIIDNLEIDDCDTNKCRFGYYNAYSDLPINNSDFVFNNDINYIDSESLKDYSYVYFICIILCCC